MDNENRTFNNGYFETRPSRSIVQRLINGEWVDTHTDIGNTGVLLMYRKYGHRDDFRLLDENGNVAIEPFDREYNHELYDFKNKDRD
jgi:uncharacterized protein (DUF608 family)